MATTTIYGEMAIVDAALYAGDPAINRVEDDIIILIDGGVAYPPSPGDLGWDLEERLTTLSDIQRQIVIGRLVDNLSCTQIGKILGISYQRVVAIYDSAINNLRIAS